MNQPSVPVGAVRSAPIAGDTSLASAHLAEASYDGAECARLIARALVRRREELGWTIDQLADHTGLSTVTLTCIEAGRASYTLPLLGKLAAVLGLELQVLLVPRPPAPRSWS